MPSSCFTPFTLELLQRRLAWCLTEPLLRFAFGKFANNLSDVWKMCELMECLCLGAASQQGDVFFLLISKMFAGQCKVSDYLFSLNIQYFVTIFTWSRWSLIHIHLTFNTQHKQGGGLRELYTPCTRHNRSLFHTAKIRLWGNSNAACFSYKLQAFPGKSKASVRLILWDKSS